MVECNLAKVEVAGSNPVSRSTSSSLMGTMKPLLSFAALFVVLASAAAGQSETRRYLYLSNPDGAQSEGRSGTGILIFDIDDGHKFVRRIHVPIFKEGIRGFTGTRSARSVFYSTTNRRLGRFDLETETIVWEKTYSAGCDRSAITPDGKKIYVPTGWWYAGQDSGLLVVDGETGELMKRLHVGPQAHNSIVSLDGRYVFLGTRTMLTMFDTKDESVVRQIKDIGEKGVFPYTVKSNTDIAFVCLGNHIGFEVVDLKEGRRLHRVLVGEEPILHRTHGAGLTPDETELWISDQIGQKLFIFDATQDATGSEGARRAVAGRTRVGRIQPGREDRLVPYPRRLRRGDQEEDRHAERRKRGIL